MKPTTASLAVVFFCALCGINSAELNLIKEIEADIIKVIEPDLTEAIEPDLDPDTFRNVSELITSKGYPVQRHTVQTSDGFLLIVHRIPHGRNGHSDDGIHRPVVILQHGILSAASAWVLNFQNQSLGFILADANYDVWLGNSRGNLYSRRHLKYTPEMKEFWNFSFDEMAAYDLKAMIDYALKITGEKQLYYIGYSQGTTSMFGLLSQSRKYNRKVKLFIALAPVAFTGHINSAIKYLGPFANDVDFLLENLGVNEFLPSTIYMQTLSELVCGTEKRYLCENAMFLFFGRDKQQLNETRLGVYTTHYPDGTSTRSLIHYLQMMNSKRCCKYDYGEEENMKIYKQTTPPEYNLSRITVPVVTISGMGDNMADPEDVNLLKQKLRNLVESYIVPWEPFNHLDFTIALDANSLVYDKCLTLLSQY